MDLTVGQTLKDRYRIVKMLGQGGFGAVYRAWDVTLNSACALKENFETSPAGQKQFLTEARLLANLRHPNLPRVTDYFVLPGQGQYLVMDYVDGDDLRLLLEKHNRPLDERQVLLWIGQVCQAIEYLHSQAPPIIHRDIKPANIKITPQDQAMLVDFGLAKVYSAGLRTTLAARAISPGYSPQEQYGLGTTDERSDIYSLGATMYHLLTNQPPVESIQRTIGVALPAPRSLNCTLSVQIERVILQAMEPVPTARYSSIIAMRMEFPPGDTPLPASGASQLPDQPAALLEQDIHHSAPGAIQTLLSGIPDSPAMPVDPSEKLTEQVDRLVSVGGRTLVSEDQAPVVSTRTVGSSFQGISKRTVFVILAGLSGFLIMAVLGAGLVNGLVNFLPATTTTSNVVSAASTLELTGKSGFTLSAGPEGSPSSTPQPTAAQNTVVLQGTTLPAAVMTINPDNASSLELLGVVPLTNRKSDLSWSGDSRLVIVTGNIGIHAYNLVNLEQERTLFAGAAIICFDLNEDQGILAGGGLDGQAILWDTERGTVEQRLKYSQERVIITSTDSCSFEFSSDGKVLFTASSLEKDIRVWDTTSGLMEHTIANPGNVTALVLSPDGQELAAGSVDGTISLYNLLDEFQARQMQPAHQGGIRGLAFSPDGLVLSYTFDDGYFESVRSDNFEISQSRILGLGGGDSLAYSPDGSLLAVGSDAYLVGVFLSEDMHLLASLPFRSIVEMAGSKMQLAFSPDGRYLAGTFMNVLYIWGIKGD